MTETAPPSVTQRRAKRGAAVPPKPGGEVQASFETAAGSATAASGSATSAKGNGGAASSGFEAFAAHAGTGADPMIHLEHITMAFGNRTILNDIDLKVPRGKITVVMGGSGSGKSTTLKLIVGFIHPNQGQIWIDGQDVLKMSREERLEVQKSIGMSFQYSALFDSMTVFDNVAFPLREHTKLDEPEIRRRVIAMLERLGLPGVEDKMPSDLSGGMKKRVGVARAIMLQPKIMLFDEPESGLDPITTTSIAELIMEMRDSFRITCLVISHNLQSTRMIADKVCMLYKGKIIAEGSPAELDANPDPVLQQFLHGRAKGPY